MQKCVCTWTVFLSRALMCVSVCVAVKVGVPGCLVTKGLGVRSSC